MLRLESAMNCNHRLVIRESLHLCYVRLNYIEVAAAAAASIIRKSRLIAGGRKRKGEKLSSTIEHFDWFIDLTEVRSACFLRSITKRGKM